MKKTNLENKLKLRRETMRALTTTELRGVVGGAGNNGPNETSFSCPKSDYCTG